MSRWELTDEIEQEFLPIVKGFIDEVEGSEQDSEYELNLTDTELNPYTLWKLLEKLGYEKEDIDSNGWQMDFWITFEKEGHKTLEIDCTGITFELKLVVRE